MTIRLRRTLINSTSGVLLIKGGPGKGRDRGGAASRRVPALHATLSENCDLLRQTRHRLSRRRTPRRHRLDQAFIRHALAEIAALFAVPFDEIAPLVERSESAARQFASRARRRQEPTCRIRTWPQTEKWSKLFSPLREPGTSTRDSPCSIQMWCSDTITCPCLRACQERFMVLQQQGESME